jgi:hypothetical protein
MPIMICSLYYTLFTPPFKDPPVEGHWISKIDRRYKLIISKDRFIEIYERDTTSNKYWRTQTSCDSSYYRGNEKLDFIKIADGRCFEVTALTASKLAYRYTPSNRLWVFERSTGKKRILRSKTK